MIITRIFHCSGRGAIGRRVTVAINEFLGVADREGSVREREIPMEHLPFTNRIFSRGGITNALQNDWPIKAVGDRANVTKAVLEKHYDVRSKEDKMENRREYLDSL